MKTTLKIEFDNKEAALHFAEWLCVNGEQQYWQWMEEYENYEEGDITAVNFHYHGEPGEPNNEGYGDLDFIEDLTIRTTCGRITNGS
jgi:hypothetical protein